MYLAKPLTAFLHAAARVALGFRAASQGALTPEVHQGLSQAIDGTPEFEAVIDAAIHELPRFAPKKARSGAFLHRGECADELRAFLRRSGCYRDLWQGKERTAEAVLEALLEETRPTVCTVRHLIPLDGLELGHGQVVDFGAGRIVSLSSAEWDAFFEADLYPGPNTNELSNLGTLEIETSEKLVTNPIQVTWEAPSTMAAKLAGSWIAYVDLWSTESVHPIALYSKARTLLNLRPVQELSMGSPTWIPAPGGDEDEERMEPFFSVSLTAKEVPLLGAFMRELEAGRHAACRRDLRVDNALRWFLRVAEASFGIEHFSFGIPESLYEDLIVDSMTALEALLLASKERNKGNRISERAASLIAQADPDIPGFQQQIRDAYDLRNDIVHGDTRPAGADLERTAKELRVWLRQVLVAALGLGDRALIVAGVADGAVRATNRAKVRRY